MMTANRTILAALVVALAQIGFLGWIIAGRAAVLRDGREITLKVEPVDPRDLLRGDYVSLYYEISRIPVSQITNLPPEAYLSADSAALCQGRRKAATATGIRFPRPSTRRWTAAPGADEADVRGVVGAAGIWARERRSTPTTASSASICRKARGWISSRTCASGRSACVSRFPPTAAPQIKALLDGDKPLYEEPLY